LISPWSRNPDDDLEHLAGRADLDVVAEHPRRRSVRIRTLPGDRMRRGARTLRWCALLLATISVVGSWLTTYAVDEQGFEPYGEGWARFGQFLSGVSWSIGFAGLVFAASFIVTAYAARLDLEHTLAE
jgi:hypothetical protein